MRPKASLYQASAELVTRWRLLLAMGVALGALGAPALVHAQSALPQFVSYDKAPFGPGDRLIELLVKLDPGDTTANTEFWVVYGTDRAAVANGSATMGGQPSGRARIISTSAEGVVRAEFIFPHSVHLAPNQTDRNVREINSGQRAFYKVIKQRGTTVVQSPVVEFLMPDKLTIANLGDSYASGEGAPYNVGAKWDDELCHRNDNSGQARAVKSIKDEMKGTAIHFKNVACSGGQIAEGILLSQLKQRWILDDETHQVPVKPQLQAVAEWLNQNGYDELNIVMVSGGGNDVDFAAYVTTYFIWPNSLSNDDDAAVSLRTRIAQDIPQLYRSLRQAFDDNFTYDKVLVSEYPDPLRGADGQYCHQPFSNSPRSEFAAFDSSFLRMLNSTIGDTIGRFPKFQHVTGTGARTRGHGLCNGSDPHFNNGLAESIAMQGDPYGIVHPTRTGHAASYQPVYEAALGSAIADINRKWAIIAEEEKEKKRLVAEQLRRRYATLPQAATPKLKIMFPPALLAREPPKLPPQPREQLDALLAAARKEAANRPIPMDKVADNRPTKEER